MTDTKLLSGAFSMLSEAVAVSHKGKIVYMNTAAIRLAGQDLTSKPLDMLMPTHIANNQADSFIASAFIGSRCCTVKVSTANGLRIHAMLHEPLAVEPSEAVLSCLRSSMSNIKFSAACIEVIAEDEANEKLKEYVCMLNRNYGRIKRTLDNFGTLSGIAAGTLPFHPQPTDMTELCRNTIDAVSVLIQKQDISIHFRSEEQMRIVADSRLICQLLLNLLSNSIMHCGRGGRISVSLLRAGGNLILSVDDNGNGIDPDELAFVFESYKHSRYLCRPSGSGIGLAVAKGIAELHKGTVIIESRGNGLGTSVRVMLSYDIPAEKCFSAPENGYADLDMQTVLSELSDCLTLDCYSSFFAD